MATEPALINDANDPANGLIEWTNTDDKWRDKDAEWLQARTVARFANEAAAGAETVTGGGNYQVTGAVGYMGDVATTAVYDGAKWKYHAAAKYLRAGGTDNTSVVTLSHSGAGAGLSLHNDGSVSAATGTITNLTTTSASVGGVSVSGAAGTLTVSGALTTTGAINTASVTASGSVSGGSLATNGTLNVTGVATMGDVDASTLDVGGTAIRTGYVHATYLASGSTTARLQSNRLQMGNDANKYIDLDSWTARDGTGTPNAATIATVVEGPSFDAADYPEGTIWIETP